MKLFLSFVFLATTSAVDDAFSGPSCVVPPLACFGDAPIKKYELTSVVSDLSGIDYNPESQTMFAVNNGDAKVYEVDLMTGEKIAEWKVPSLDPEGISWLGGRTFAIPDENPATVMTVELERNKEAKLLETIMRGIDPPAKENLGFEGVAYIKGKGFLAAQEMNNVNVWQAHDGQVHLLNADLKTKSGYHMVGDLTRSCSATDEYFLLIKEPKGVYRIDFDTGVTKEQYAGQVCDMGQPEGLSFLEKDGKTYMVVVGEPTQVLIFEAEANCNKAMNSTEGKVFQCPPRDASGDKACEKTLEDGGCPLRRCNKALTPHNKICTDTVPGETDCSLNECKKLCSDGTELPGCTYFSYDVKEKECYLFEGCVDEGFDEDYVQYVLVDPTCERTLERFPKGCEQRRCAKSKNTNEKICSAKSGSACTLQECKQKCETHGAFTCTTYSFDPSNGDCYVWETCKEEGDEPDYNTYVLVDPTCDYSLEDGGCPNRICDERLNIANVVCSGTEKGKKGCSALECQAKCGESPGCAYFAHDPVDKECMLFDQCEGEKFHDDFTLNLLPFADRTSAGTAGPACANTLEDSETGCKQRRCAKAQNTYNKICKAEDGPCSLVECRDKCAKHTDFECKFYSHDAAENECYIWDGCNGEGDEEDYNTYLLGEVVAAVESGASTLAGRGALLFAAVSAYLML